MIQQTSKSFIFRLIYSIIHTQKKKKLKSKNKHFTIGKRQKFAIGVGLSSAFLFFAAFNLNEYGIISAFIIAVFSDIIIFWAIHEDLKDNFSPHIFILPFLYSLSFGLFSFLTPARILTRMILIILYAIGLYSVFLSENIFTVASIRTIALLNSARIVSLVISLIAYFFLASTAFSLRISLIPTLILVFIFSFLFSIHAIWTYTLSKLLTNDLLWTSTISVCLLQLGIILWFWPTSPTIVALFLTSIWYVYIGLSHVWLDKRLFRNVMWEYAWVSIIGLLVVISFTRW